MDLLYVYIVKILKIKFGDAFYISLGIWCFLFNFLSQITFSIFSLPPQHASCLYSLYNRSNKKVVCRPVSGNVTNFV